MSSPHEGRLKGVEEQLLKEVISQLLWRIAKTLKTSYQQGQVYVSFDVFYILDLRFQKLIHRAQLLDPQLLFYSLEFTFPPQNTGPLTNLAFPTS